MIVMENKPIVRNATETARLRKPLVSVITPTLNSIRYIRTLLYSIKRQTYPNIEHLVIDGGSTDGTQFIARSYGSRVLSEKDSGTSEAVNKGINMARGEIIGIIASDDYYMSWGISEAVKTFFACNLSRKFDAVYGDTLLTDINGNNSIVAFNPILPDIVPHLRYGFFNVQPFFFRKAVFDKFGGFNTSLKVRADYEFFVRTIPNIKVGKVDEVLACYRFHPRGISRDREAFDKENTRINSDYQIESLIPSLHLARHAFFCSQAYALQLIRFANGSGWQNFKKHYQVSKIGLLCNIPLSVLYIYGVRLGRKLNHGFLRERVK